ncbi:MAG: hypothetical protein ACYTDT_05655 [Planctomycetota bacterium]|jgi:hypothetical protein
MFFSISLSVKACGNGWLSDFQRQVGFSHDLAAPDLTGPRCLAYRALVFEGGNREESLRYVALYDDNSYAGMFGTGDELPDGARLITDQNDDMWGLLSQRRYKIGDTVDRYGRILRANDPGYLNARIAGGKDPADGSYGVLAEGNSLVGNAANVPNVRVYKSGDHVLDNWDTEIPHGDYPNETYKINGKVVGPADARFGDAEEIDSSSERYGQEVVGKPVKMLDNKGRPIRKYLVTYQAGDILTQAEWDIYRTRLGEGILARYTGTGDIVGRPLTHGDPVVGLPKIKLGFFAGEEDNRSPETLKRGIDQGGRGPNGEVELVEQDYVTGRLYDPKKINPEDFMRDPDGEFTTWRTPPVHSGANLDSSQAYIYAPLGGAMADAVPVPSFDQYGAWKNFKDEVSYSRIPLVDSEGKLVRDSLDQIQYLKEYEYEYIYLYEYERQVQDDEGFTGSYAGDQFKLNTESVKVKKKDGKTTALLRLVYEERDITMPQVVTAYKYVDPDTGEVSFLEEGDYPDGGPAEDAVSVQIITSKVEKQRVVIGVHTGDDTSDDNIETWDEAEARAIADGYTVEETEIVQYVNENRNKHLSGTELEGMEGVGESHFEEQDGASNNLDMDKAHKIWRRWTVPPPLVVENEDGEKEVLTRLSDKVGPATRYDGKDAPRFLTRYISEMWGVAIFKGVRRDWDYANVYVKGLRGTVSNRGLRIDGKVTELPNPADGGESKIPKTFLSPQYVNEEWVYRTRYQRLGDEYETFRDLIRRQRTFWYLEESEIISQD